MVLPASTEYPARVYFFAQKPDDLIAAGYDSIRVEKRKSCNDPWKPVLKADKLCELKLASGVYNYHYTEEEDRSAEFRAVLQNSVLPGTPADIPQPATRAVDLAFESIMTVKEFHDLYLWGQDPAFVADDGKTQPEYTYAHNIRYGIAKVEKKLGIKLLPTRIVEKHDFMRENGVARGEYPFFPLDAFPVIDIESVKLMLPGADPFTYPASWLRWHADDGQLYIVPDGTGALPVAATAYPSSRRLIPDAYEITYFAGFKPDNFPVDLKEVVGKEGAFGPLNVGGDLVGGAGLAGSSLSLDGLSQSITTTNSSTNAGFGARLIQYEKELKETYKTLVPYYRGLRLRVA